MAEVNENTKIAIRAGSVVGAIILVLMIGRWWGSIETERTSTDLRLTRNEADIAELQKSIQSMQLTINQISDEQKHASETMATVSRNTTAVLYETSNIKVALAERGFRVPKGD